VRPWRTGIPTGPFVVLAETIGITQGGSNMIKPLHKRGPAAAITAMVLALALVAAACGSDDGATEGATDATTTGNGTASGNVINVPEDHDTIQAAVDAASPGDLILIAPGVYNEAVDVETDDLTIRGLDRNEVILDGEFELTNGFKVVGANGVAIENMTARQYTSNAFFWTGVNGYRGSYLTSYRTGDYGIYAFDSVNGQLEDSYASGSRDAGFYIGQCYPCDAVIDNVVSEWNGLGYSGTNAGGNLLIINSTFRLNRAGIVPNTGSYELCYPQRETTIVGNIVYENQNPDTPAIDVALLAMGNGILVAGGIGNDIERNLVFDHERTGIGIVPFPEEGAADVPDPDADLSLPCSEAPEPTVDPADIDDTVLWSPRNNRIIGNVVSNSGLGDIAVGDLGVDLATLNNCFSDNEVASSAPADLQTLAPCDGTGSGDWNIGALNLAELILAERPPETDWKTTPVPDPQPNMPDADSAPGQPARDMPRKVDVAAIAVPTAP